MMMNWNLSSFLILLKKENEIFKKNDSTQNTKHLGYFRRDFQHNNCVDLPKSSKLCNNDGHILCFQSFPLPYKSATVYFIGLPWCLSCKEFTCQCGRCKILGFDLWVRKIPQKRKLQSTPVFLPGESLGQRSWWTTVRGVTRGGYDLVTKPPAPSAEQNAQICSALQKSGRWTPEC